MYPAALMQFYYDDLLGTFSLVTSEIEHFSIEGQKYSAVSDWLSSLIGN